MFHHADAVWCEPLEARQLLSGVGDIYVAPDDPRLKIDLSQDWKFIRQDVSGAQDPGFNDSTWLDVDVPHSWNALDSQDGGGDYYRGIGWYRRMVQIPPEFAGKSTHLKFDGSSLVTNLYVDGTLIGEHRGAFGAFSYDLSTILTPGAHTLAVKVDNSSSYASTVPPQSGDFPVNGGIYRKVWLVGADPAQVTLNDYASPGVYFSTPAVSASSASVQVKTGLRNAGSSAENLLLRSVLVDDAGVIVAQMENTQALAAGQAISLTQNSTVANPRLWHGRIDPYLYDLYVEVRDVSSDALLDLVQDRVGIRSYQISPSQGFLLNGQPYALHGVNAHQDRQDKAWAISDADVEQDVLLVLEIGATAFRTAHYQQSERLYDLADEHGLVVWTEIPVNGSGNGGTSPGTATFQNAAAEQLRELIRQNFNHPSIVVWSVFNEINDNATNRTLATALNTIAKAEDPTRPTTAASWNGSLGQLERITDTIAYNRYYGWYYGVPSGFGTQLDSMHSLNPTVPIGVSEYGAGAGITQHQFNPPAPSAGGLWHPEEYQNYYHEETWKVLDARPWLWTTLIWNMFDFAVDGRNEGDTPGRNDKGLVTFDRQTKKDSFYFYKANWSDDPVLYITSRRWTQRSSPVTQIKVYSNLQSPQLIVNGVSLGTMTDNGYGVWTMNGVGLISGQNTILVNGTHNGQQVSDSVVWQYATPPEPGNGQIKVNFQPADGGSTPAGYLIDTGAVFADRGNGQFFGWNLDNSANTRRRNVHADVRYDTLTHLQRNGSFTWEIALPNGTYDVFIGAGDPSWTDSIHSFSVEGVRAFDSDGWDNYDTNAVRVTVGDGRLTIAPTQGGVNAKLEFVEITAVDVSPPQVLASSFAKQSGHSMQVQFSEPLDWSSVSASDLEVKPLPAGTSLYPSGFSIEVATNTVTFTFATRLPDGNYVAEMVAGSVRDIAGNPLGQTHESQPFFVLAADANGDRRVDTRDFNLLAGNFGSSGKLFSDGDFDYDGEVDSLDFGVFISQYGKSLPG